MPELPEVQTVVNDLNKKVVGKRITDVWTDNPKLVRDHLHPSRRIADADIKEAQKNFRHFKRDLVGEKILRAERKGKNVLVYLSSNKLLLIHQKMTGHLLFGKWEIKRGRPKGLEPEAIKNDPFNGFVHLIITFSDKTQLALSDMRKFAKAMVASVEQIHATKDIASLGIDALSPGLTLKKFEELIKTSGPTIKQALLKPELISGIGNIYADESLHRAKIHPQQNPKKLTKDELKRLHAAIKSILRKAVRLRGTSTSDFRDTEGKEGGYTKWRLVYGRQGESCQSCQTTIKRIKVGGRGTHLCLYCQKPLRLYTRGKRQ